MKTKPNIGIINALIRITIGLTMLSWCTAQLTRSPWRVARSFIGIVFGAMKVAEGIVRYCPMVAFFTPGYEEEDIVYSDMNEYE